MAASMDDWLLDRLKEEKEKRQNPPFRLHEGVRGAHPQQGGIPTPQEDLDADDRRFGPEATFVQGPGGRDSMHAGNLQMAGPKTVEDTEPWRRRPAEQGHQLPLGSEGAFQPDDVALHYTRLKHPHLASDYHLEHSGDDRSGHEVTAYHGGTSVGFLRWNGTKKIEPGGFHEHGLEPGEIQGVSVHPDHRGKELSTAMWDYARVKVATHGIQQPVHSADRSVAGNHWAHFVGGASLARTEGHHTDEYFKGSWR